MSNSAEVRSLRRRFNFYFNTPIFNRQVFERLSDSEWLNDFHLGFIDPNIALGNSWP